MKSIKDLNFSPAGEYFPSPLDWRDIVLYSLLVDRFDDGSCRLCFGDAGVRDAVRSPENRQAFQGGNLRGVMSRLDYIAGLGAKGIWLSPVFKNRPERDDTYHGYGIHSFLEVDPRFGTVEELRELVSKAHDRGMYVILDIVVAFTGDNWAYEGDHFCEYSTELMEPYPFGFWRTLSSGNNGSCNDAVWPQELQLKQFYMRRGKIRDWKMEGPEAVEGDFDTLKKLDIRQREVLDILIRIYKFWIRTADIDGFRLDAAKHMDPLSAARFCSAIREYAKALGKHNFLIFGEIASGYQTIQQYLKGCAFCAVNGRRHHGFDAALDFPLSYILERVVKGFSSPEELRWVYDSTNPLYANSRDPGVNSVTFLDNHDRNRRFMHQNPYREQLVLALGYQLTSLGVPSIYYGTEQGFDGGGPDLHYVRECMFGGVWGAFGRCRTGFFDTENLVYKSIARLAAIRMQEPALRYGRQYFRETSTNGIDFAHPGDRHCTLAYSRVLDDDEIVVALNLDFHARNDFITIDFTMNEEGEWLADLLQPQFRVQVVKRHGRSSVQVRLGGLQMAILKKEKLCAG
ncbi:MAG: alpha-amylase family glycosyl hydrolase [Desulfomonilaceae bacterium]|nr:alpha-amylase family glycosyl hydrolase [Desulfomonilaceae bacterium]